MRKALAISACIIACASACFGGTIQWAFGGNLAGQGYSDGWVVALFEDTGNDGFGVGGVLDANDQFVGITDTITTGKSGQGWGTTFGAPAGTLALGDHVFSVIFDSAVVNTGHYKIADAAPFQLPLTDQDASYVVTSVSGSWQAVPEPSSVALFGLGLVTMGFLRRRFSK